MFTKEKVACKQIYVAKQIIIKYMGFILGSWRFFYQHFKLAEWILIDFGKGKLKRNSSFFS